MRSRLDSRSAEQTDALLTCRAGLQSALAPGTLVCKLDHVSTPSCSSGRSCRQREPTRACRSAPASRGGSHGVGRSHWTGAHWLTQHVLQRACCTQLRCSVIRQLQPLPGSQPPAGANCRRALTSDKGGAGSGGLPGSRSGGPRGRRPARSGSRSRRCREEGGRRSLWQVRCSGLWTAPYGGDLLELRFVVAPTTRAWPPGQPRGAWQPHLHIAGAMVSAADGSRLGRTAEECRRAC